MYKASSSALLSFINSIHPQASENRSTSLYLSCLQRHLFASLQPSLLLHAFIPPYCLVKMISKLFTTRAFIALIILASNLTSSVNAAPARQFLFVDLVVREGLY